MVFIAITMLGYISYTRLDMELMPVPEMPELSVSIRSSIELDPDYIENQAVIPVEGAVGTLEDIEEISSSISRRNSSVSIAYKSGTNMNLAYLKLLQKMDELSSSLSEEFTISVNKMNTNTLSNQFMSLQILGEGGEDRIRNIADQDLVPSLESIDGIASVNVFGGSSKTVEIVIDPSLADAYKLTPNRIMQKLKTAQQDRTAAGEVYKGDLRHYVNVTSEFNELSDIENTIIDNTGPILLKDIASISFDTKEPTSYSRVNGKDIITILLVSDTETNQIDLSHRTHEAIKLLNEKNADLGLEIIIQSDSAEVMEDNINQIINLAIIGGLLAMIILWYFLQNLTLVVSVALAIPISIYAAFNFFYAYDITINSLSLIGMALAVGMLIDNSVVVLENIYRLVATKMPSSDAVIQGVKEVWKAITASTLTTVAVFVPFLFSENEVTRLITKEIGVSIVSTLLISLLAAILLVPMITSIILSRFKPSETTGFTSLSIRNRFVQIYLLLLKTAMRSPAKTIIGALILFFITLTLSLTLKTNMLKEIETNKIDVYITMPTGSTLEKCDDLVAQIEDDLLQLEERQTITSKVEEETAIISINLIDDYKKVTGRSMLEIKNSISSIISKYKNSAEIDFSASTSSNERLGGGNGRTGQAGKSAQMERMLGMGTSEERIEIKGDDYYLMSQVCEDIEYYLEELDEISQVKSDMSSDQPEIHLNFSSELMTKNDIELQNISQELRTFDSEVASGFNFQTDNEEYEIIIRMDTLTESVPKNLYDLQTLEIENNEGSTNEMQSIAQIYPSSGISRITRINLQKQLEISYSFSSDITESVDLLTSARANVDDLIATMSMPDGVAVEVIHEEDDFAEYSIIALIAILLIYMILASVFESFSTPFVLMFAIPMAAIGSLIALLLTGNSIINANTLIGFIILIGVVINNGIILIDYSNTLRKQGYKRTRTLMMAGIARLRPILITALTTITAMIPLAMGNNEYVGAIGAPFAITVIGGLALSTLLTLVFIPTLYSALNNAMDWFKTLPMGLRVIQYVSWIGGTIIIYTYVNNAMWQIIDGAALFLLVPGVVWFLRNSLRQASENVIDKEEEITITIRNLVKIYGRESRFAREWKSGIKIRERFNESRTYLSYKDLDQLTWLVPLLLFFGYFTFFYLEQSFWQFTFSGVVYAIGHQIIEVLYQLLHHRASKLERWIKIKKWLWHWVFPCLALAWLYLQTEVLGGTIILAILVYVMLLIDVTSKKIHREKINVNRLEGRLKNLRKVMYRFVLSIPLIGKKDEPFKALKGVSLTIEKGMFGLLGPNGAGKSTLMRCICGVYDQSYGKIFFNDIDTSQKREELQGIIGYLPQEFGMYENMSAWDYLDYQSIVKKIGNKSVRDDRIERVLKSVHMWDDKDKKIGSFSGGMKQRIGIAQVLLHLPRVLVVDEPTAGLDPRERIRFRNLLVELSRKRIVIFSTHIIEDISSSCQQMAVLKQGEVQYVGSPRDMAHKAQGHVWQIMIDANQFEEKSKQFKAINHLRDGDKIRMRVLAQDKPCEDAVALDPNLEDAYLWLQQRTVN